LGNLTSTETLPDEQRLVAGRDSSVVDPVNRQLVAPWTTASRRTVPPAAGSVAGLAVKRPTLAAPECRRGLRPFAKISGCVEAGAPTVAAGA
jgi:hypothetical protein